MFLPLDNGEVIGLMRAAIDAHTLGIDHVAQLLEACRVSHIIAGADIVDALDHIQDPECGALLANWIAGNRITRLGFSYRLDPSEGKRNFDRLLWHLREYRLLSVHGGPLRAVYFAGLPETCDAIRVQHGGHITVFCGDESPVETLTKLGLPTSQIPMILKQSSEYDEFRLRFGEELIRGETHYKLERFDRAVYPTFGTRKDHLISRLAHARRTDTLPILRAHVGPFDPDRHYALRLFKDWLRSLAGDGLLDVVSIGTSQLTQERFGQNWNGLPNGGGVPVNSPQEYEDIWKAARPMLVRTYAGTRNVPAMARIHEITLNIAWHALSFWWFCQTDGRGPNSVLQNLYEHFSTLDYIARTQKPFEPNVPHHFAFRGGDDITFVLSAYLAAKAAKLAGVRFLVLQVMLNTPRHTWGIQDLAKARAMLQLIRTLETSTFRVILQPRAGLDHFSPDLIKARGQLAAVTALMDDIEPDQPQSPPMIHVVSFSEAVQLADPSIIKESLQITLAALQRYRLARTRGDVPDMLGNADVRHRTETLVSDTKDVLKAIERHIPQPYSPAGLYKIFASGFLPVPYLWKGRDEFAHAVQWRTHPISGGVSVIDETGSPVSARLRAEIAAQNIPKVKMPIAIEGVCM